MHSFFNAQNVSVAERAESLDSRRDVIKRVFLLSLLLSTWIPMAFFISIGQMENLNFNLEQIKVILLFLGGAHVPATLFFYTDKDFYTLIRENKVRYLYFPITLIIISGLLFAFSNPTVQAYLFLIFWAWQAYHYGRQNTGIYSFASIAQENRPPRRMEKLALELAAGCGILGTFKILGMGVAPPYLRGFFNHLYQIGYDSFLAVLIFSLYVFARNIRNSSLTKTLFFFTLIFFFFPIYLSNNINVTFFSYAVAHGLQYFIFMTVVSINSEPSALRNRIGNVAKLIGLTLLVGFLFYHVADLKGVELIKNNVILAKSLDFVVGAVFGAPLAHFVIDAGAWRLSKSSPRVYMIKRFGFILD